MPRKTRFEERIRAEQDTVGAMRAERLEQVELAGRKKKADAALTKAQRMARLQEKEREMQARPPRVARVGKPLKRP